VIIGIDNGLSGAIVALSTIAGLPPVEMISMPVMQVPWSQDICGAAY